MMYIHYCSHCNKIFTLNGHKTLCPKCSSAMQELDITYLKYLALSAGERSAFDFSDIVKEHSRQNKKNP